MMPTIFERLTRRKEFQISLICLGLLSNVVAYGDWNLDKNGVLIHGHDPVSYFSEQKPILGRARYEITLDEINIRFKSAKNRDLFLANPTRYLPAYGGYCSYGVALGKKLDISPEAWKIVNDVLYLQLDQGTKLVWEQDYRKNILTGNRIWSTIENLPAAALSQ